MPISTSDVFHNVQNKNIFTRTWTPEGAETEPPVVLSHDSLGCVEMWREFPQKLAEITHRPVIAFDRWGHGNSELRTEPPGLDFIEREADFLVEFVTQLGLVQPILIGHSVGAGISLVAASLLGRNCQGVVSMSAQGLNEDKTRATVSIMRQRFISEPPLAAALKPYHGDRVLFLVNAWADVWLDPRFGDWQIMPLLRGVTCPVCIIHGDQDEYCSLAHPRAIYEALQGPRSLVVLPGVAHFPHRQQPERVLTEVKRFIEF